MKRYRISLANTPPIVSKPVVAVRSDVEDRWSFEEFATADGEVSVTMATRSVSAPAETFTGTLVFSELSLDPWDDAPEPHEIEAKA